MSTRSLRAFGRLKREFREPPDPASIVTTGWRAVYATRSVSRAITSSVVTGMSVGTESEEGLAKSFAVLAISAAVNSIASTS